MLTCMKVSLNEMEQLAMDVVASLAPLSKTAHLVALSGNLGAGKTTFVQHLARTLGVVEQITSPTFVLMKQYGLTGQRFSQLVHIDAYRIESLDELQPLRFNELVADPTNLILVEWPEHIAGALPQTYTTIALSVVSPDEREVTISYAKED